MIINAEAYLPIHIGGFTILHHQGHIILTQAKSYKYLLENEVLFQCDMGKAFQQRNVFQALGGMDNLPKEFAEYIANRSRDLRGESLHLFADPNRPMNFCKNKEFASHYGISNPTEMRLTVIETFSNESDFDKSFTNSGDEAFGFWDVEKDLISSSYIWAHPSQTKLCFSDFGRSDLLIGSLFLKFKVEKM